jgi:hypothetical protein
LSSDPNYFNYEYQPDIITAMSGLHDRQAPSTVYNNEACDCEYQNVKHIPIFRNEAYKSITTLEDASLQLGHEFSVFTAPHSCQPSQAALDEAQRNICKLRWIVGQLGKLYERINESDTDQKTKEAYEHIYTSVSEKYLSCIQQARKLHAIEGDPLTGPESSLPTSLTYFPGTEPMASPVGPSTPTALPINEEAEHAKQSFTAYYDNYYLIHESPKDSA